MFMRLHSRSKMSAQWLHNFELGPEFDRLAVGKTSGNLKVEEDAPRFVDYGPQNLLRIKGRPAREVEYCDELGTKGDLCLTDLSQYIGIMGSMQQASSMHLYFETDEEAFRLCVRIDGKPAWLEPMIPFKGADTSTQSPTVVLANRS